MTFAEPITSLERALGVAGELLTVTSGKSVFFIDAASCVFAPPPLSLPSLPCCY
jgi:hypothetical protein